MQKAKKESIIAEMSAINGEFSGQYSESNANPVSPTPHKTRNWKRTIWEACKLFVIPIALVLIVRIYIIQPFIVKGTSMEPNFEDREYLIVDEISPVFKDLSRGAVLIFRFPFNTSEFFIKRLIALPGEHIVIKNNKITITTADKKTIVLAEPYLARGTVTIGDVDMDIPPNQYFVLGDNRTASYDSRRWGLVPKEDIIGRAFIRLWPVYKIGLLKTPNY